MARKPRDTNVTAAEGIRPRRGGQAAEPEIRNVGVEEFVRRLRADTNAEKRFALFLGAGCSVTSGIPTAGGLVRDRWLPRLRDFKAPARSDLDQWAGEVIPGYDPDNPARSYGTLINQLLLTTEDRQREIEDLCDGRTPSFGYAVLAQLIAQPGGRFNVVLTTNFDDLISDSLYLYTEARPLVIYHESLAAYIRPTRTRPLVVKLHGDHRLSPRNTELETEKLEQEIQRHTAMVLHDRGVIFMGYGGADQGILKMLKELPPEALPYGAYWVHPHEPHGPVRQWLAARQGIWVQSGWFDEVMLLIRNEFGLAHPSVERFTRIFQDYHQTFQALSSSIQKKPPEAAGTQALQKAVTDTEAEFPDFWKVISEAHRLEVQDPQRADAVYRRGVNKFPKAAPLLGNYAVFLTDIRKDLDTAEAMYRQALEAEPGRASNLGNYALFLTDIRKDHETAEAMYIQALEADPRRANTLSNYAVFLYTIRKDYAAAEAMYKQALEADPRHANALNNYANFLKNIRKDYAAAEAMYKRALEANPRHADILTSYANLLYTIRKDHDAAEAMYKRALDAEPRDGNLLANFARFLLAEGRAEGLTVLDRALELVRERNMPSAELECAFYLFAHGPLPRRTEALRLARKLVEQGVRSPYWDLSRDIDRALQDGHPEVSWLPGLAAVINDEAQPDTLSGWPAWQSVAA